MWLWPGRFFVMFCSAFCVLGCVVLRGLVFPCVSTSPNVPSIIMLQLQEDIEFLKLVQQRSDVMGKHLGKNGSADA